MVRAMDLTLPDLFELGIEALHLCAYFDGDDEFLSRWTTDEVNLESSYPTKNGEIFIRLVVEAEIGEDGHGHIHFDIAKTSDDFADLDEFDVVPIDDLFKQLEPLKGREVFASIAADFVVAVSDLPHRGMIRTILGVSTESCGSQLSLSGAEMSIHGDLFQRLKWRCSDDDGIIEAQLYADTETEIGEDYISSAAKLMRQGVECFVLETEEGLVKYVKQNASGRDAKKSQA